MRSFIVFLCLVPTLLFARQTQLETQLKEAIKGKKAEIGIAVIIDGKDINPEKPDVPLNKNDAFQKVQKRRVQENGERGPIQHDQSPPFFFHLNPL